ncbi:LOW QUALITY PROTEIN: hypothetical protein KUTeg_020614 [Tegillarca granosa]|uniref:Uncharacterized protein n=1 Tax=Tegillarca granosa TaxID=220873 RepID=A0ABQ9E8I0_TEGGR|nr:LOW QUALITY PROTEIN: hypothetical protein KUTeg_020614 [Tegillarca granosa]
MCLTSSTINRNKIFKKIEKDKSALIVIFINALCLYFIMVFSSYMINHSKNIRVNSFKECVNERQSHKYYTSSLKPCKTNLSYHKLNSQNLQKILEIKEISAALLLPFLFTVVGQFLGSTLQYSALPGVSISWPNGLPPDIPHCGFTGELCEEKDIAPIIGAVCGALVVLLTRRKCQIYRYSILSKNIEEIYFLIFLIVFLILNVRRNKALYEMRWKIIWTDLNVKNRSTLSGFSRSMLSIKSVILIFFISIKLRLLKYTVMRNDTLIVEGIVMTFIVNKFCSCLQKINKYGNDFNRNLYILVFNKPIKRIDDETDIDQERDQVFASIGVYEGNTVAIRKMKFHNMDINTAALVELLQKLLANNEIEILYLFFNLK